MSQTFQPTPHPILTVPTPEMLELMGDEALMSFFSQREQQIALEKDSPFEHGWEPPIWLVCDCLLGLPWVEEHWQARGWPGTGRQFRERLGFEHPIDVLLILGGQRGGKSQYEANRCTRILQLGEGKRGWCFHSTLEMSREYQQPLHYMYFPPHLRGKDIKTSKTYIAYKEKTGFTDERYILPSGPGVPGSRCTFKSYDQDRDKAIEGGEVDIITPDELVPADWVKTMELRIATRRGKIIIGFTPVNGYSDTVAMFLDGARTVMESVAYLCPKDGGPPEPWRALGLERLEYEHLLELDRRNAEERTSVAACAPQSRPEECQRWFEGVSREGAKEAKGEEESHPSTKSNEDKPETNGGVMQHAGESPADGQERLATLSPPSPTSPLRGTPAREFERVPRILKCADPKRAVVFFHSRDNPYGNPKGVWKAVQSGTMDFIKERFYGVAKKTVGAVFDKFDWNVHTVEAKAIPAEGTNWHLVDPHGIGRNYAMIWIRSTPEHDYVYREWPGNYYIPDIGVPGPWATAGNAKHPDGLMGPGQRSFGWGHLQYKRELARVEGWPCYRPDATDDEIRMWDQWCRRGESIQERQMDSRFASVPKQVQSASQTPERPVTLLTEMDDVGLTFHPTSGDSVSEGVRDIENALYFRDKEPVSFHNKPRLLISRDCLNTIFALQIWTGLEKDKGATAEWIGLLRYFYRGRLGWLGKGDAEPEESGDWQDPYADEPRYTGGFR